MPEYPATKHAVDMYGAAAMSGAVAVSMPEAPVVPFTRRQARKHTDSTKRALDEAYDGVMTAYDRQAWVALKYDTWSDYLAAEFGDLRVVRLTAEERVDVVGACREQGMSYREIAKMLGVSTSTVHAADPTRELRPDTFDPVVVQDALPPVPEIVRTGETARKVRFIDRVIAVVKEGGAEGATCRDVKATLHEGHQRVSAALTRAHASGRLTYEPPAVRGQHGRYRFPVESNPFGCEVCGTTDDVHTEEECFK